MKKIKFNKKLQLNKETIANLNLKQMNKIKGGYVLPFSILSCNTNHRTCDPCCPVGTQSQSMVMTCCTCWC